MGEAGLGGCLGFCGGFSRCLRGHSHGGGLHRGPGHGACRGKAENKEWIPITKLGRLLKEMKIKSLEEIYKFSLPITESKIVYLFFFFPRSIQRMKF